MMSRTPPSSTPTTNALLGQYPVKIVVEVSVRNFAQEQIRSGRARGQLQVKVLHDTLPEAPIINGRP